MSVSASRQQYISDYAEYAMAQMRRYGIPASVTLAQGIIESANGKSTLAQTANNHFGIKGSYEGHYVLANDDKPNERFKKYDDVGQSFEDHSKVLMAQRYQQYVSGLAHDDYKGWAEGIKKGGYATDSRYVSTIVSVIESNNLQQYDQMVMEQMRKEGKTFGVNDNPLPTPSNVTTENETPSLKSTGFNLQEGQYSMPIKRDDFMLVTSPYGQRKDPLDASKTQIHHGIDIRARHDAILATENGGTVIGVDERTNTGGGKTVTVEYAREDGSKTQVQYMHLSKIEVKKGDVVNAGQQLGVTGNTGTRTTGEHLHFGVINVSADGKMQWVNPAAYLAEINQRGNLQAQAQHNGKDLLAQYRAEGMSAPVEQKEHTPDSWMQALLASEASGMGMEEGGGLLDSIMKMFMTLLTLAMTMENKSREEKMEAITDAVLNKRIDLTGFTPQLKSASIAISGGSAILTTHDGKQEYSHTLTQAEQSKLSQILNSDMDDESKKQRIGTMVYAITISQQASVNYEQIASQEQSQQQTLQRK